MFPKLDYRKIELLKNEQEELVIDSLTHVISRQFIIKIAKKLIEDNKPFTLMILDLDNFKHINDTYGHLSGDFILNTAGEAIISYCQDKAYVGRYGGDEFLILLPNKIEYDDVHTFLEGLYERGKIFRKYYNDGERDIYLTATLGCATFPKDSEGFEELFTKADKALYRGKTKGRNCFIIYLDSKHKDIIVRENVEGSIIYSFNSAKRLFDIYKGKSSIIKNTMDYLYTQLHCSAAVFLTPDKKIITNYYDKPKATGLLFEPHLEMLLNGDDIFYESPLTRVKKADPVFEFYVNENGILSLLVSKLVAHGKCYGYIIIYEKQITRIWQESEIALIMFISELLKIELINLEK